jgi:hypothetical protein
VSLSRPKPGVERVAVSLDLYNQGSAWVPRLPPPPRTTDLVCCLCSSIVVSLAHGIWSDLTRCAFLLWEIWTCLLVLRSASWGWRVRVSCEVSLLNLSGILVYHF